MTAETISFHGDESVKAKYLARVERHIEADNLIRGTGWRNGKGCAVGCTLEAYDYYLYPVELGLPEWLAHLEDRLFEGMSEPKSRTWPKAFLDAIPVGISEARFEREVKAPFLVFVLDRAKATFDHTKFPDVMKAIEGCITSWLRDDIGSADWKVAVELAREDAIAARAYTIAYTSPVDVSAVWPAAVAVSAVWAARAAYRWPSAVAVSAVWAAHAVWAARATEAAISEQFDLYADKLIELLQDLNAEPQHG